MRGALGRTDNRPEVPRSVRALPREATEVGGRSPLDFSLTTEQEQIRRAIERLCAGFDDEYWLKRDQEGRFPDEFHRAVADAGWLGIAMPQDQGVAGLGITEIGRAHV